ncbi:hypothetical protein GWK47_034469 [Chionoecetes opilio]|uniref:BED-type domain-containing protein n=1 Tax=Chionoecetes opilio TaxID=41210 RepID=A0A8J5D2Y1_CHIOP|nr:hypothetical protein GWK47_034469 [Chionoecetes opilio]
MRNSASSSSKLWRPIAINSPGPRRLPFPGQALFWSRSLARDQVETRIKKCIVAWGSSRGQWVGTWEGTGFSWGARAHPCPPVATPLRLVTLSGSDIGRRTDHKEFFDKKHGNQKHTAVCTFCKQSITDKGGTTSVFIKRLRRSHPNNLGQYNLVFTQYRPKTVT